MIYLIDHPDVEYANYLLGRCQHALLNIEEIDKVSFIYARPDVDSVIESLSIQVLVDQAVSLGKIVITTRMHPRNPKTQNLFTKNNLYRVSPDQAIVYTKDDFEFYSQYCQTFLICGEFNDHQTVSYIVEEITGKLEGNLLTADV
jgi:hypothetical protein